MTPVKPAPENGPHIYILNMTKILDAGLTMAFTWLSILVPFVLAKVAGVWPT